MALTKEQLDTRSQWTSALRSGVYRQAKNCLRTKDGFCCLGVLADIVSPGAWRINQVGDWRHGPYSFAIPCDLTLRKTGASWDNLANDLAGMNDLGADFDTIADAIDLDTMMHQDGAL